MTTISVWVDVQPLLVGTVNASGEAASSWELGAGSALFPQVPRAAHCDPEVVAVFEPAVAEVTAVVAVPDPVGEPGDALVPVPAMPGVPEAVDFPELAGVPERYLREPWTMPEQVQREVGCTIGEDYPRPIVEHAQARREALERYRV